MRNKVIIPTITLSLLAASIISVKTAQAFMGGDGNYSSMAQKIAQRFGLDQSEVETLFQEERDARQAQRQADFEQRLNQALADGQITAEQKQLILEKHTQLQSQRQAQAENWQELEPEERKELMETHRQELQNWAEENGIDIKFFQQGKSGQAGRGGMKRGSL